MKSTTAGISGRITSAVMNTSSVDASLMAVPRHQSHGYSGKRQSGPERTHQGATSSGRFVALFREARSVSLAHLGQALLDCEQLRVG